MSSKTETEIATIVTRACAGDNAARDAIIKRFHDRIYRLVFYRVKNKSDAEDITQEVFIKVLKKLPKLKDPDRLKAWVYTIAVNQVNDFHKKNKLLAFFGLATDLESLTPPSVASPFNDKRPEATGFFAILDEFLKTLPKSERDVFLLKYIDGLTIAETATILRKNESTVKTCLYRGLKKMKSSPQLERRLFAEVYDARP